MSDRTISPVTPLLVTMQAKQWNLALSMMNEGLSAMASVIADVQRQCLSQQDAPDKQQHLRPVPADN
jgi:hypothetical protein